MSIHSDKSQEGKESIPAKAVAQKKNNKPSSAIADNRPANNIQKSFQKKLKTNSSDIPILKKGNRTGLPDNLKSGIENLSGISMDDVKVHYNSDKPAQLQAHAYAQGTDIHLSSGQEKHLPHEAWHVVQQKQGRVKPTTQMKGKVNINDDAGLEKEADMMGTKALNANTIAQKKLQNNSRDFDHTIQKVDKVINYGSGTSSETLMKSETDHFVVDALNIDSGHMLLAEVIQECLIKKNVTALGKLTKILLEAFKESEEIEDLFKAAKQGNMSWMKQNYFHKVSGFEGVMSQVQLLGDEGKELFKTKSDILSKANFKLGDATSMPQKEETDAIYCINGYGYSPLTESKIFMPMAKSLKKGGKLIIMSDIMGPTVRPFLEFGRNSRVPLENLFYLTREENVITQNPDPRATMNIVTKKLVRHLRSEHQPISKAFAAVKKNHEQVEALSQFNFDLAGSSIYVSKSAALGHDILTMDMQSRHTEGGTELDESVHVTLVFTRK